MRVEAHYGPAPLRKTAGDDPILVWVPTSPLPVNTGRPAHMTMFKVSATPDQIAEYFTQKRVKIYTHTSTGVPEIFETPGGNVILWLNFSADPWFLQMSGLFQQFLGSAGFRTTVDTGGEQENTPHVGIQYGNGETLEEPKRALEQNNGPVSFEGPFVMNGNTIFPRQGKRSKVSSVLDVTIDMLEMLN